MNARLSCSIHESFLMPVVGPVLNQSQVDSQISVTAYLDLFVRSITSAHVMRVFLRFLLTDQYDNKPLLDILISHINSDNSQVYCYSCCCRRCEGVLVGRSLVELSLPCKKPCIFTMGMVARDHNIPTHIDATKNAMGLFQQGDPDERYHVSLGIQSS